MFNAKVKSFFGWTFDRKRTNKTKQKRRKLLTEEFSIRGGRSCVRRLRRILFSSRIQVAADFDVIIIEKKPKREIGKKEYLQKQS